MIINRITTGVLAENCYIVNKEGSTDAVIVDPGGDFSVIEKELSRLGLTPKAVLLTHGHFDHITATNPLVKAYGCKVYAHSMELDALEGRTEAIFGIKTETIRPDKLLFEDCAFEEGGIVFQSIHTPGHSKGSVSYYAEGTLFSGDTLFELSCGRTDFPGGSPSEMRESLKKLMELPPETRVLPGHGNETSIGFERSFNPYV